MTLRRFAVRLPHMQRFIAETQARIQFAIYLAALIFLAIAAAWPGINLGLYELSLVQLGGLALSLSSLFQAWLLWQCWVIFRHTRRGLD